LTSEPGLVVDIGPRGALERDMPVFFFSETENGDEIADDNEGLEFDDLEDACHEAERALREIAAQAPLERKTLLMTILDEDKNVVHRAKLEIHSDWCGRSSGSGTSAA
jgi:hypothetical protein